MMKNLDVFIRPFGPLLISYIIHATLTRLWDVRYRPYVCDPDIFSSAPTPQRLQNKPPILLSLHA